MQKYSIKYTNYHAWVTLFFSGRQTVGSHSNKGDNCILSWSMTFYTYDFCITKNRCMIDQTHHYDLWSLMLTQLNVIICILHTHETHYIIIYCLLIHDRNYHWKWFCNCNHRLQTVVHKKILTVLTFIYLIIYCLLIHDGTYHWKWFCNCNHRLQTVTYVLSFLFGRDFYLK
jgi:hypothetical protein